MNEENGAPSGDSKKVILIVGAVAVVLAIVLLIAFMPREPEVDPYVVQLEQEVAMYTGQIDSLNSVVDGLNGKLNTIRAQMDSARESNRRLLSALHKVTNEMKEYRALYREQQELNQRLVSELNQAKAEKEKATAEVRMLKTELDSVNNALYEKTTRLVRLESSLEEAVQRARTMEETVTSVLVYIGAEDELKQAGYLKTWRPAIFSKNFRVIGFPDVTGSQSSQTVRRISLGETLVVDGELDAVCDRHGRLDKGKEYEIQERQGKSMISFIDSMLQGQKILVVLKK